MLPKYLSTISGEKELYTIYRHKAYFYMNWLKILAVVLILLICWLIFGWSILFDWLLVFLLLIMAWYVATFVVSWRYNQVIVTNIRLIVIEQSGVFKRAVTEIPLAEIQNISVQKNSFWDHLFSYGSLVVKTENKVINLEVKAIPKPFIWRKEILEIKEHLKAQRSKSVSQASIKISI